MKDNKRNRIQTWFYEMRGTHMLTGAEIDLTGRATILRFVLDSVTYDCVESQDGANWGMLYSISVSNKKCSNMFEGSVVEVECEQEGYERGILCGEENTYQIELVDKTTGRAVVTVGTCYANKYYPTFLGYFDPTAMACNQNRFGTVLRLKEKRRYSYELNTFSRKITLTDKEARELLGDLQSALDATQKEAT